MSLTLTVCYRLMWNKEVGRSRVFVARNLRNWARLNTAEPNRAVGHLFSANASGSFCTLHSPSLPSPNAEILSSRDSESSYHNSSVLDYSHPAQWLVGASRPRLPTQMGVQACDGFHMSHRSCKSVLLFSFFFNVFLSISHLFRCLAL